MMDMDELAQYCLSRKAAVEDYPFGPTPLVVKVSGKMFALLSEGDGGEPNLSLKCDPHIADMLRMQFEAVIPGYHLNKRHWNTVIVDGTVPESEMKWMIDHSHELVVKSLTKAQQAALG